MKLTFDTSDNDKQKKVCVLWTDKKTSEIVYGGSKGSGKSYLGAGLIFGDALIYPKTHYFIARKKLNDLRKFTIPTLYECLANMGITENYYKFNGQDNFFELYNQSKVFLLEAAFLPSDPLYMRFGSMAMTRGWIEEAGEFEESAKGNLMASIGRWKNEEYGLAPKLLQTCNPAKNYLYREFYQKHKSGTIEEWKAFVQALPTDNKKLPAGYLENLQRTLDKNQRERLLEGNWEYDDDPRVLIDYENIINLFGNITEGGKKYITADIARYGKDKTTIGLWYGLRLIKIITIDKCSTMESAKAIKDLAIIEGVTDDCIIVDEDGVGGGVVDILGCKGFVNNSSPMEVNDGGVMVKPNFNNLKSQCYFKLADKINAGEVAVMNVSQQVKDYITQELEQVKQKEIDGEGKKAVISKDEMKEALGRSPDYADMMMMRMYGELLPEAWESWVF